jgi:cytochrome c biogenesis protein CcmG/thiol:disulfide interchange protein DsbE
MTPRAMRRIGLAVGLAAALAIALVALIAGGGSDSESTSAPASSAPADAPAAKGLPRALADHAEQGGELQDGGLEALEATLGDLEGYPVVVNQWGSWCPPCRAEFPFFAESAQAHLDEVAFLGVDIQDDRDAAEDFLAEFPTPYPHVFDQDTEGVRSLEWQGVSPTTWLIDEQGEIVHQRPGAYASRAELDADIDRFLLRG